MTDRFDQGPRTGMARRFGLYFLGIAIGLVFLGFIQSRRPAPPAREEPAREQVGQERTAPGEGDFAGGAESPEGEQDPPQSPGGGAGG